MPDLKISQLPVATTPLAGTELVPIVQGGVTDQTTVGAIMTSTVPSGTANGVLYLNGSKVATSGTDLVFNATGLGIGTSSPASKLNVVGGTANTWVQIDDGTVSGAIGEYAASGVFNVGSVSNHPLGFRTNNTERMRLDSSGNLGLGMTPSAWSGTNGGAFQFGGGRSSLYSYSNAITLGSNVYYDTINKYVVSGVASSAYQQLAGVHYWLTAPSGTAGNAISFTQAMTLDASGRLLIGTTTQEGMLTVVAPASMGYGTFDAANSGFASINFKTGGTAYAYVGSANAFVTGGTANDFAIRSQNALTFAAGGGTERARITSGGDLYVGQTGATGAERLGVTTTGATQAAGFRNNDASKDTIFIWSDTTSGTNQFVGFYTDALQPRGSITYNRGAGQVAYNITSDVRLKKNIADANDAGSKVDALQVRQFDWKETGNHIDYGFVAQELEPIVPHAVSKPEAEDGMWSVDYSKLVPMLIKEIQSLRARVQALEAQP